MTYETFTEFNASGVEGLLTYPAQIVPIFIPVLLAVFFLIIALASYFSQKRLGGSASFVSSFAVASYVTTVLAIAMTLIPNLINTFVIIVCLVISALATLWLYISKDRE